MIRSVVILFTFCLVSCFSYGQVEVVEDAHVSRMMKEYIAQQKSTSYVEGYRIQIIATPDRRKMESTRAKFTSMYPDVYMEWEHVSPYYQVRVGAFETKMDLMAFMIDLKKSFRDAIPVVSDVEKSELIAN